MFIELFLYMIDVDVLLFFKEIIMLVLKREKFRLIDFY